jgi:hypothetical protein
MPGCNNKKLKDVKKCEIEDAKEKLEVQGIEGIETEETEG